MQNNESSLSIVEKRQQTNYFFAWNKIDKHPGHTPAKRNRNRNIETS